MVDIPQFSKTNVLDVLYQKDGFSIIFVLLEKD